MMLVDENATKALGEKLAGRLREGDVVTLSGPLGVGKTALARAILRAMGHGGDVPSPSFAIVQPYDELKLPIWHVDLFRLDDPSELEELGLETASDGALLIEWPEKAGQGTWPDALRLTLEFADAGARRLTASVPPSWQSRWSQA